MTSERAPTIARGDIALSRLGEAHTGAARRRVSICAWRISCLTVCVFVITMRIAVGGCCVVKASRNFRVRPVVLRATC
jgi:hypothetical protein